MSKQLGYAIVAGVAIGQLGWVDAIFIPLVIAGPIATGAVAATRRVTLTPVVAMWVTAGVTMLVEDWLVNHEDAAFHAALSVVMGTLAAAAWATTKWGAGRRSQAIA